MKARTGSSDRSTWRRWTDSWVVVATPTVLTVAVFAFVVDWTGTLPGGAGTWAVGASSLLPLALLADTLGCWERHTGTALRATATGAVLSLCALGVYTLLLPTAVLAGQADRSLDDSLRGVVGLTVVAVVSAAAVGPLVRRMRTGLADADPTGRQITAEVRRRLRSALPLDELLLQLAELLRAELAPAGVEIWTAEGSRLSRRVGSPSRPANSLTLSEREQAVVCSTPIGGLKWLQVWIPALLVEPPAEDAADLRAVPLTHAGELLGILIARRASARVPFQAEDDELLVELARQLALAVHNVRLDSALQESLQELRQRNVELQASRARIVATADAARRRLERDLHDGGQKDLTQLARTLRSVQTALDSSDAEAAAGLLTEAQAQLKEATETLRELAHGIFPTPLRDFGLGEGLRSAARRSHLPVRVEVNLTQRHLEQVETAVYFCCLEALQNAGKYAGEQARIRVLVEDAGGLLTFEVTDDGVGYSMTDTASGQGFLSMQDRVGALGGRLRVESAPGSGTRVRGEVPLR